jgi:hypothetical protein
MPEEREGNLPWFLVARRQAYIGEEQANGLRIVAIFGFYAIHLMNYHGLRLGFLEVPAQEGLAEAFHRAVTSLAVAWIVVALAVRVALRNQVFPAWLGYASTAADVLLLTAVLVLADGPSSPLVIAYLLVVAAAALRMQVVLVMFAALTSAAGYLFTCGFARWYAERQDDITVPRYHQLTVLLTLVLAGWLLARLAHRGRAAAVDYHHWMRERADAVGDPGRTDA